MPVVVVPGPTVGAAADARVAAAGALVGSATARIGFARARRRIAPGQSVVLYDGDEVVGGGIVR